MSYFSFSRFLYSPYSSPFGFSVFTEHEYIDYNIDFKKLCEQLKGKKIFYFNYEEYIGKSTTYVGSDGLTIPEDAEIPFQNLRLSGKLSKYAGNVNTNPRYIRVVVVIVRGRQEITYSLNFNYDGNDINTSDKQYAIILEAHSFVEFESLLNYLGFVILEDGAVRKLIISKFNEAFKGADAQSLNFLYADAPAFVIAQRGNNTLLSDLSKLAQYDEKYWDKDASSSMLKVMGVLLFIYEGTFSFFKNDPVLTWKIYNLINSYENKQLYCLFLMILAQDNYYSADGKQAADLPMPPLVLAGKGHQVTYQTSSDQPGRIAIVSLYIPDDKQTKTAWLNPLDLVNYIYIDDNGKQDGNGILVPAIYVAYMTDRLLFEQTTVLVRGFFDFLAILASIFPATAVESRLLRVLMGAISATDLVYLQLTADDRKYLEQVDGEPKQHAGWFLSNWDTIYHMALMGLLARDIAVTILSRGEALIVAINALSGISKGQLIAKIKVIMELARKSMTRLSQLGQEISNITSQSDKLFFEILGLKIGSKLPWKIKNLKNLGLSIKRAEGSEEFILMVDTNKYLKEIETIGSKETKISEGEDITLEGYGLEIIKGDKDFMRKELEWIYTLPENFQRPYISELIQESVGLIKRVSQTFKGERYYLMEYSDRLVFKLEHPSIEWTNKAELWGGELSFDFNTGTIRKIGSHWVDETFKFWGNRIKSVSLDWGKNEAYPGGESLGYKQYMKIFDETGDELEAVKGTDAYKLMGKNGFGKIKDVFINRQGMIIVKLEK